MPNKFTFHRMNTDKPKQRSLLTLLFKLTFPGREMIPFEGQWWIVRDEEKNIAGFCAWCPASFEPKAAFMSRAAVLENYRGQGLQVKMLKLREKSAREAGFSTFVSCANRDNPASMNSFIKAGYKTFWPEKPLDDDRVVYFKKTYEDTYGKGK